MVFSEKLNELRNQKKVSMDEMVADLERRYGLHLNKSTISRWENGAEIKGSDLLYVADYFQIDPHDLMDIHFEH